MKVRIAYTVEVSDDYRRALNFKFGMPGLASREQVRQFIMQNGDSADDDLFYYWQKHIDSE